MAGTQWQRHRSAPAHRRVADYRAKEAADESDSDDIDGDNAGRKRAIDQCPVNENINIPQPVAQYTGADGEWNEEKRRGVKHLREEGSGHVSEG